MSLIERLNGKEWWVEETGFDLDKLGYFESIFTVGNGYQGTRGSLEEGIKGELSGCYLAGIFDNHDSTIIDLVNAPNWLSITTWIDGKRLDMLNCAILEHRRILDLRAGLLYRRTRFGDNKGRRTSYESLRFADACNKHLCSVHARVTPENYDAEVLVESAIVGERYNLDRMPKYANGQVFDPEVKWAKWAKSRHLQNVTSTVDDDMIYLQAETIDTGRLLAYSANTDIQGASATRSYRMEFEKVSEIFQCDGKRGQPIVIDKLVSIATSRDTAAENLERACREQLISARQQGYDRRLQAHKDVWADYWKASDCVVDGNDAATNALRFNIYHLLIAANQDDPGVSIGAKSLSGEGYKGHVFWDTEIFLLPFYIYTQPDAARALLMYRYNTMPGAMENARKNGFKGAQYAWESADTGLETTPKWTADGAHRIWTGEEEIHITADVAYGVMTYVTATYDWKFLCDYGAELVFNTARFWESRLEYNDAEDRYELNRVIGPDEFHEHVDNNTFTNWMVQWNLQKAIEVYGWLERDYSEELNRIAERLSLDAQEAHRWRAIAEKIFIPYDRDKNLIEQFDGYFECKEAPITEWDENSMPRYPAGYDHFNAGETDLVKQPDVVMLLYVLPDEFDDEVKRVNYDYYERKTMHKSSLSPAIHSIMGIEVGDWESAEQYFRRSAWVDLQDNQRNTEWGVHIASAGGTWMCAVFGFGGFRVRNGSMTFKPWLPDGWQALRFALQWRGKSLSVKIQPNSATFCLESTGGISEDIVVYGKRHTIAAGEELTVPCNRLSGG